MQHDDPRPGDVARLAADATLARDVLGYETRIALVEGLRLLRAWYEEGGKRPNELLAEERVRNWEAP